MIKFYERQATNPTSNAQRNLAGRTHYVDPDTLRFHKSHVLETYIPEHGLIFALVESVALDYENTTRGFRYVLFDIFGHVIGTRRELADAFKTRRAATKAMYAELDTIDAVAVTRDAVKREIKAHANDMYDVVVRAGKIASAA